LGVRNGKILGGKGNFNPFWGLWVQKRVGIDIGKEETTLGKKFFDQLKFKV